MIASVSGVRGVLNSDMSLTDLGWFAQNFARTSEAPEILVARDTRSTGPVISRTVIGAIAGCGKRAVDFGVISTPALFRESLTRRRPAVMITASHNEPEFNGLKFIVEGRGLRKEAFAEVTTKVRREPRELMQGSVASVERTRYVDDLVKRFGEGSCEGVRVALDMGGGAAITHAVPLFGRLGCEITAVNDAYGVFNRRIDPTNDGLELLRQIVKAKGCDIGFGFDCDGDRLVVVDDKGNKRTGDYMLTLALSKMLASSKVKDLVVSVDTTQAIDVVAASHGVTVHRSRVGEANVVQMMAEFGAGLGGEGSSGGLIDTSFNYCRDSLLAALVIVGAIRRDGKKVYESVKSFHQHRIALQLQRAKAQRAIKTLAARYPESDTIDGVKVWPSKRSWVLVRTSGTEDIVRVSAEAEKASEAEQIAQSFSARMKELSK